MISYELFLLVVPAESEDVDKEVDNAYDDGARLEGEAEAASVVRGQDNVVAAAAIVVAGVSAALPLRDA